VAPQLFTQDLARNIDCAIGVVALPFVLYDSLSKKADVTAMKAGLDLLRAQILSKVVAEFERGIGPFLTGRVGNIGNVYIPETPPILNESAKSALTDVIRQNETAFFELRLAKSLPGKIHSLNTTVFVLMVAVMVAAFASALILTVVSLESRLVAILVAVPVLLITTTVGAAVVRHIKVQDAEKRILSNDSQA
jgi:uncharacterized membrane protein (DUF485 family)